MNTDNFSVKEMIHRYVTSYHTSTDSDQAEQVYRFAEDRLYQLTRSEIIKDLTESEKRRIDRAVKQKIAHSRILNISLLLIESGLLACLIGLLVNQITNGITLLIPKGEEGTWIFLLIVIILLLIVLMYFLLVVFNIRKYFDSGDKNESDEP